MFGDATELAYGAACYIRLVYADDRIVTQLVLSKAKAAPLKAMTIPRLELKTAVLCIHIGKTVS